MGQKYSDATRNYLWTMINVRKYYPEIATALQLRYPDLHFSLTEDAGGWANPSYSKTKEPDLIYRRKLYDMLKKVYRDVDARKILSLEYINPSPETLKQIQNNENRILLRDPNQYIAEPEPATMSYPQPITVPTKKSTHESTTASEPPKLEETTKKTSKEVKPLISVKMRRELLGKPSEMAMYAADILERPEERDKEGKLTVQGKRHRARSAIDNRFPTSVKHKSGLCHELNNSMYKDELMQIAKDLELPVTKTTTKAELCQMLAKYAKEAAITQETPEDIDEETAEKTLRRAYLTPEIAKENMEKLNAIQWNLGDDPEDAQEFLENKGTESVLFPEFPPDLEQLDEDFNINRLTSGQLDLIVSLTPITLDLTDPMGEDMEVHLNAPVSIRDVLEGINQSVKGIPADELGNHIYYEGISEIPGKPGHFEVSFGS